MTAETTFPEDDVRLQDPKFQQPRFRQYVAAVDELKQFAEERFARKVAALALRWVLDQGDNMIALWGARKPEQLSGIDSALGWRVDPASMLQMNAIVSRQVKDPVGPEFLAPPERKREAA